MLAEKCRSRSLRNRRSRAGWVGPRYCSVFDLGARSNVTVRPVDQEQATMGVAALAAVVGVAPDTIRYYERVGFLPAATRTRD